MAPSAELRPVFFALLDSVMLLAPKGWNALELKVESVSGGLRVTELSTRGQGSTEPRPKPDLHVNARDEALRLSEGIAELAERAGKGWAGGVVKIDRTPDFVDWKLVRGDGSIAFFTRLERGDLAAQLMTDELFDAVLGTERAFTALQQQFEQRLGPVRSASFDPDLALITFERPAGPLLAPAQLLGSYDLEAFAWEWGWAETGLPPGVTRLVREVCRPDAQAPGFAALWREQLHCDEGFAWALLGHVLVSIGGRGLYRIETSDRRSAVFFAVMSES